MQVFWIRDCRAFSNGSCSSKYVRWNTNSSVRGIINYRYTIISRFFRSHEIDFGGVDKSTQQPGKAKLNGSEKILRALAWDLAHYGTILKEVGKNIFNYNYLARKPSYEQRFKFVAFHELRYSKVKWSTCIAYLQDSKFDST